MVNYAVNLDQVLQTTTQMSIDITNGMVIETMLLIAVVAMILIWI